MKTTSILLGLALAAAASQTNAQPGPQHGAGGPHRYGAQQFPPPIALLDKDANGVLSAAEIAQAPAELLKLDKNNDGQVSAEELCLGGCGRDPQQCPRGGQGRGRGACANGRNPVLLALFDADKDGALTSAEINGAPAVLKALDQDGDGQVSAAELRPLPGCGRGCPFKPAGNN